MERSFPSALGGRYLTYKRVVSQLLTRYKKEIVLVKRPALRMILNRDVASNRLLILCVSQIFKGSTTRKESDSIRSSKVLEHDLIRIELTDGWYSIPANLDDHLSSFLHKGKILVGTKLLCIAEMVGAEDGIDPLDSTYDSSRRNCPAALRLHVNSTRLAKWNAQLGFLHPSTLSSENGLLITRSFIDVIPGGGPLPLIDVIVCRRYNRLFLRKCRDSNRKDKTAKLTMILSEAQEEKVKERKESLRQHSIEKARLGINLSR